MAGSNSERSEPGAASEFLRLPVVPGREEELHIAGIMHSKDRVEAELLRGGDLGPIRLPEGVQDTQGALGGFEIGDTNAAIEHLEGGGMLKVCIGVKYLHHPNIVQ